jgi:hypothetical protein
MRMSGDHSSHRPDTPPAALCRARTNSTQQAESAPLEVRGWLVSAEDAADPKTPHQLTPAAGEVPDSMTARVKPRTPKTFKPY